MGGYILDKKSSATMEAERINRKVQTLGFVRSMLTELNRMAANENLDMLCYLIEMAAVESDATIFNLKARAIAQSNTPFCQSRDPNKAGKD
jgi:hypothetical protein